MVAALAAQGAPHGTTVVADPDVVNVVNWSLPDGAKGLPFQGGSHPLHQVWLQGR